MSMKSLPKALRDKYLDKILYYCHPEEDQGSDVGSRAPSTICSYRPWIATVAQSKFVLPRNDAFGYLAEEKSYEYTT